MLYGYSFSWLFLCFAVGYFATTKGKNGFLWGVGAFFFSPILLGIILALSKDDKIKEQVEQVSMEQQQLRERVAMGEISTSKQIKAVEQSLGKIETEKLQNSVRQSFLEGGAICPHCGQVIKRDAVKCRYCGADIEKIPMVECPYCKELIRADAAKCKYCQSEVLPQSEEKSQAKVECPYCKELVSTDAKFCEFCGSALAEQ